MIQMMQVGAFEHQVRDSGVRRDLMAAYRADVARCIDLVKKDRDRSALWLDERARGEENADEADNLRACANDLRRSAEDLRAGDLPDSGEPPAFFGEDELAAAKWAEAADWWEGQGKWWDGLDEGPHPGFRNTDNPDSANDAVDYLLERVGNAAAMCRLIAEKERSR